MAVAIEMFLEPAAEATVGELRRRLVTAGLVPAPRGRPHITLAVTGEVTGATRTALRETLATTPLPALRLSHLGLFPHRKPVLFLGLCVTGELLELHRRVHAAIAAPQGEPRSQGKPRSEPEPRSEAEPLSQPGRWVPHCTLARRLHPGAVGTAVELLGVIAPIDTHGSGVGAVTIGTGHTIPLTDRR